MKTTYEALTFILLPTHCLLCRGKAQKHIDLCAACENELPRLTTACQICGIQVFSSPPLICGQCQQKPPHFDRTFAIFNYKKPVNQFVTQLKFQKKLLYTRTLSHFFISEISKNWYKNEKFPDIIIPVSLHKKRLKQRGFNQAIELAKPIVKHFSSIKLDITSCKRIRNTQAQTTLQAKERRRNVKNAFYVSEKVQEKHIAILDDVVTTGGTVNELSRYLRRKGAKRIDVWCVARAQ